MSSLLLKFSLVALFGVALIAAPEQAMAQANEVTITKNGTGTAFGSRTDALGRALKDARAKVDAAAAAAGVAGWDKVKKKGKIISVSNVFGLWTAEVSYSVTYRRPAGGGGGGPAPEPDDGE